MSEPVSKSVKSLCQPGANPFIEKYFFDCVYDVHDAIGFTLGLTSILIWVGAQLPQFISNYKNKSAEALSIFFLIEWFSGDTLNLLGCLIQGEQLPTTTILAIYFVMSDVVMLLQYIYYMALKKRHERLLQQRKAEIHRQHQQALQRTSKTPTRKSKKPLEPGSESTILSAGLIILPSADIEECSHKATIHQDRHRHSINPEISTSSIQVALPDTFTDEGNTSIATSGTKMLAQVVVDRCELSSAQQTVTVSSAVSPGSVEERWLDTNNQPTTVQTPSASEASSFTGDSIPLTPGPRIDPVAEPSLPASPSTTAEEGGKQTPGRSRYRFVSLAASAATVVVTGATAALGSFSGSPIPLDFDSPDPPTHFNGGVVDRFVALSPVVSPIAMTAIAAPGTIVSDVGQGNAVSAGLLASLPRRFLSPPPLAEVLSASTTVGTSVSGGSVRGSVMGNPVPSFLSSLQGAASISAFAALQVGTSAHASVSASSSSSPALAGFTNGVGNGNPGSDLAILIGTVMGYLSTLCYLASRISQIYKNYKRNSAEGLSWVMFCMTVSANMCTGIGMLIRTADYAEFISQLPWLCGTFGTVMLDITIVYQTFLYSRRNAEAATNANAAAAAACHGSGSDSFSAANSATAASGVASPYSSASAGSGHASSAHLVLKHGPPSSPAAAKMTIGGGGGSQQAARSPSSARSSSSQGPGHRHGHGKATGKATGKGRTNPVELEEPLLKGGSEGL